MSELATSKQLWTINKLASELGITTSDIFDSKEFSLPLTKDEASLLVARLKIEEKNSFPKTIGKLADLQKKTAQEEYWAKTRKN